MCSQITAAKVALKDARAIEKDAAAAYDRSVEKAKWRIWKKARIIACTAASAVHVTRRLMQVSFTYITGLFYLKKPGSLRAQRHQRCT